MTAFRPVTDDEWKRMPWHAQQRWLLAANALRRQLTTEVAAVGREHRSAAAHALGLTVAFDLIVDDGAYGDGPTRLDRATDEAWPNSSTDHAASA